MRRIDREITNAAIIDKYITDCNCCRLGFNDNGKVYIVPLNFGFVAEGGKRTFYFHGAFEGRKIDLIKATGYAAFELDYNYRLQVFDAADECTAAFRSIIGDGKISIVEDVVEKRFGLLALMEQATGRKNWDITDETLGEVCIFKLEVAEIACKEHL